MNGFRILPPVVKGLLLINVIVFLGMGALKVALGIDLTHYLAFHHITSQYFRPHQIVTYMFLHGDIAHIFFNMFSFWMFGSALENYWGSKRFLIYYMVTGIGAVVIHTIYNSYELGKFAREIHEYSQNISPDLFLSILREHFQGIDKYPPVMEFTDEFLSYPDAVAKQQESIQILNDVLQLKTDRPTVGASGAVFGILLAFGMMFPNTVLFLMFIPIPIKAKYFVIFYGALELYLGIQSNPGDNVAHFAHLGGMLFGYFLIIYWKRKMRGY